MSGKISTVSIQRIIDRLKLEQNHDSTRKNYYAIWKVFNAFFVCLDAKPFFWEDRLVLFVAYFVDNNRCPTTINSYISTIKAVLLEDSYELAEDRYLLNLLTKACKYRKNNFIKIRLPIHKDLLHLVLKEVDKMFLSSSNHQPYLAVLYKTILSTGYYGLFRIEEVTKGTHPVLTRDVHIGQNK